MSFEINLYSNKQEFYTFATDDFALLEIGIGSYNISSIANFFSIKEDTFSEIKPMNPDTKEFFSNEAGATIANKLIGQDFLSDMKIMEFDIDTKTYKEVAGFSNIIQLNQSKFKPDKFTPPSESTIRDFLQQWNKVQQGFITDEKVVNGYKAVAYKIQNSLSGCITFNATLNILQNSRSSLIRLNLLDNADNRSERSMSFNGSPFISAVPRTPYGAEYSFNQYSQSATGAYDRPVGENNPRDAVAGQLATSYDPSTGEFVSGTQQMMARLLEDIDTADIPELTVEQLQGLSREEIYDNGPESPGFMGSFKTGKAIPLSAENGNPHMFGPDFNGGCSADKKVQITVINRLNQKYRAGSIVVVSRMLGESGNWVIVSPGTDTGSKKKISFGNFEYQKYVIPTSEFFRRSFAEIVTPNSLISKIRNHYYATLNDNIDIIDDDKTYKLFCNIEFLINLNILASLVDYDEEKPATKLYELYNNTTSSPSIIRSSTADSKIDKFTLGHSISVFRQNLDKTFDICSPNEFLPKNILRQSKYLYKINVPEFSTHLTDDFTMGVADVPFWGILFSDGYKADQCKKFYNKVKETIFLGKEINGVPGDPNLSELSFKSTLCAPFLNDTAKSLLFLKSATRDDIDTTAHGFPSDLIRKTGGVFTNYDSIFIGNSSLIQATKNYVEFKKQDVYQNILQFTNTNIFSQIYGLEPVNPAKLQFSPLSIEQLYATSTLNNPGFQRIKDSLARFNAPWSDTVTKNFLDYIKYDSIGELFPTSADIFDPDGGNQYPNRNMTFKYALDLETLTRHPAPVGVLRNGTQILPQVGGYARSPLIPVLACKSTISTNATSLLFTVDQYFGSMAKKVVQGGQGPSVTFLPIGGGIGWSTPGNPVSVNASPQWGDNTRTDNYDSMGTTALHIRVFEAWPFNQTIYLGHMFTPIHFNPSTPGYKYEVENLADGTIKLKQSMNSGQPIVERSEVDFRLPTNSDGYVIPIGNTITKENLKPISEWRWTSIRRAKLVSNGGFAYLKPSFGISSVSLKTVDGTTYSGRGYKQDTKFTYPDGSSFKVNVDKDSDGKITSIKDFVPNHNEIDLIKDDSPGILSLDVTPVQSESEGSGAVFEPVFKLVGRIVIDKGPKELSNIKRLTKPSDMGTDAAQGISTTVVDIEGTNSQKFDIFYFFHNDPTHYSIDCYGSSYYRDLAQYVISEVKPA